MLIALGAGMVIPNIGGWALLKFQVKHGEGITAEGHDRAHSNPLMDPRESPAQETSRSDGAENDEYRLSEIAHGRMLCIAHGRVCYQRVSLEGEQEWVCPDERHRKSVPA
jgi:hypothetical protein